MVKRYKTKPCEIEAVQWNGDNKKEVFDFCNECEIRQRLRRTQKGRIEADYSIEEYLVIPTLEGDMEASIGDYIIKGLRGEFYPCKPDVFEKKYELVI